MAENVNRTNGGQAIVPVPEDSEESRQLAAAERSLAARQATATGAKAARAVPEQTSAYTGVAKGNKFAAGEPDDEDIKEALATGQQSGASFVSASQVQEAWARGKGTPGFDAVRGYLREGLVAGPARERAAKEAGEQLIASAQDANINPVALMLAALMESQKGKNADLQIIQKRLTMYHGMAKEMAHYGDYMLSIQQKLDAKVARAKDKDKPNVDVPMEQQLSFTPESMLSLDMNGKMITKDLVAGKSGKDINVTVNSLQQRITEFGQQRDQLGKLTDKDTQNYTNSYNEKNQLVDMISQLMKSVHDSAQVIGRNL